MAAQASANLSTHRTPRRASRTAAPYLPTIGPTKKTVSGAPEAPRTSALPAPGHRVAVEAATASRRVTRRARALLARAQVPGSSAIQREPPRRPISPDAVRERARPESAPPRSAPSSAVTAKKRREPAPRSTATSRNHSPHGRRASADGPTTSTPARHRNGSEPRPNPRRARQARRGEARGTPEAINAAHARRGRATPSTGGSRAGHKNRP